MRPGIYEITTQTAMPHLEEALRYADTRERRCLRGVDLATVFPVLQHPSLAGCKLANANRNGHTTDFALVCASDQVATGAARLEVQSGSIDGVVDVKMGGKNMTFSQRVQATRRGNCAE